MLHRPSKNAFGLLEVLIVLAIAATTMIAATQIALNGYRAIKVNEILDYANGLMLQALEIAKSPTDVEVVGVSQPPNFNASYRLSANASGKSVMSVVSTNIVNITPTDCSTSSPYFVNVNVPNVNEPLVCLQLVVTQRTNFGVIYYEIRSRMVYNLDGQANTQELIGYRRNDFRFTAI